MKVLRSTYCFMQHYMSYIFSLFLSILDLCYQVHPLYIFLCVKLEPLFIFLNSNLWRTTSEEKRELERLEKPKYNAVRQAAEVHRQVCIMLSCYIIKGNSGLGKLCYWVLIFTSIAYSFLGSEIYQKHLETWDVDD